MPLPLNHGVSTITEDHAQHISSALLNFRWHPCGRPVIAALDARMRDALMGVLNRRQEVLRAAGKPRRNRGLPPPDVLRRVR
jgi:hypothetical protein